MSEERIATKTDHRSTYAKAIHPIVGGVALLTIVSFLASTVVVEFAGTTEAIIQVKTLIPGASSCGSRHWR